MELIKVLKRALKLRFSRLVGKGPTPPRRYPEQSLRQANRRFRRAQGGPGLDARNMPREAV